MATIQRRNGEMLNLPRMTKPDARRLCAALNEAFALGGVGGDPAFLQELRQ